MIKSLTVLGFNEEDRMKSIFKIGLIFLAITGATSLLVRYTDVTFGRTDYFEVRGWFFLFFVAVFPRLTLLFSSVAFGGILWWLGFFFAPRILVATLATFAYWNTNPALVTISWLIALSGEASEKYALSRRGIFRFGKPSIYFKFNRPPHPQNEQKGDVFEAEYKVKD